MAIKKIKIILLITLSAICIKIKIETSYQRILNTKQKNKKLGYQRNS